MRELDIVCKESIEVSALFHAVHSINVLKTQISMLSSEKPSLCVLFYANLVSLPKEVEALFLTELKLHVRPFLLHSTSGSSIQILSRDISNQEIMANEYNLNLDQWMEVDASHLQKKVNKEKKSSAFQAMLKDKWWITVNCQEMLYLMLRNNNQSQALYQYKILGCTTSNPSITAVPVVSSRTHLFLPLWMQYELKKCLWGKSRISDVISLWEVLREDLMVTFFQSQEKDYSYWELFPLLKTYIAYKNNIYGMIMDKGPAPSRNTDDLVFGLDTMFRSMHDLLMESTETWMIGNGIERLLSEVPLFHEFFFLWTGEHDRRTVSLKSWIQFYNYCRAENLPSCILEKPEDKSQFLLMFFAIQSFLEAARLTHETEWMFRTLVELFAPALKSLFLSPQEDPMTKMTGAKSTLLFEVFKWCSVFIPEPKSKILCLFHPNLCFVISLKPNSQEVQAEEEKQADNEDDHDDEEESIRKVSLKDLLTEFHEELKQHDWMKFMKTTTTIQIQSKRHQILISHPLAKKRCASIDMLSSSELVTEEFLYNLTKNLQVSMKDLSKCVSFVHKSQMHVYRPVGKAFYEKVVEWMVMLVNIRRTQAITNSMMMLVFGFCLQEDVEWNRDELLDK